MILPGLSSQGLRRLRVTYLLVVICVVLQLLITPGLEQSNQLIESALAPQDLPRLLQQSVSINEGDISYPRSSPIWSKLALRHPQSVDPNRILKADPIGAHWLRRQWRTFQQARASHSHLDFGFVASRTSAGSQFSYQFVHASWSHLAVNMAMLILLGFFLEPGIGILLTLVIFLGSGWGGAYAFSWFSGTQDLPLVGASASVMGLMGALMVRGGQFSILAVAPAAQGFRRWQMSFAAFGVYLLALDVAGVVSAVSALGSGVAHVAHLGGLATGAILYHLYTLIKSSMGANPRRTMFSVTTRGSKN